MPTRGGAGGTALVGALTVNATISQGVQQWAGSATFAGAGGLAANSFQYLNTTALYSGTGLLAANAGLASNISAAFSGAGSLSASGLDYGQILATFSGAGALAASAKHFVAGVYDETGSATASDTLGEVGKFTELEFGLQLDRANLVPGDVLEFRVYLDGVALDSYVTPSITVAASTWTATAAFAGAGGLSVSADFAAAALVGSLSLAGSGQLSATPQLLMAAREALAGAGSLSAASQIFIPGSVAFSGAGSLSVELSKLVAGWSGESTFAGAGNLSATASLFLRATSTFAGIGGFSATGQWFLPTSAAFSGVGSFNIDATRRLNVSSELFAGTGNFSIASVMRLQPTIAFAGEGSMLVDATNLAKALQGSATFSGLGNLIDIPADIYMPAAAEFGGVGQFDIDGSRYIWLNEQFDGQGSLDVSTDHWLAALGIFGGEGRFADIETSIISSREYWLICSGISLQPEILGDAAMAAAVAGSFELTTPLDGKPAMREC